jgi:glycine/D-amino acid oxidase-like deaminating enzyme
MLESTLPIDIDVAIVGGGIVGVSTAYALARAGVRAAIFEKGTLACEQSSRNWGWVRVLTRDVAEVPLAIRANALWREIQQQADVGFRQTGILYLQESEKDGIDHEEWLRVARPLGVDARMLGQRNLMNHLPATQRNWTGALFSPTDGIAEPTIATHGIASLASQKGNYIIEKCAVRGLDIEAGRITGVVTERGRVKANAVVVAGGAWSRLFCGNAGIDFPQLKVRASVLRTTPFDAGGDATVNGKDFTYRKRADGGYTVGQFGGSLADIVPDSFRLFGQFLPAWMSMASMVKLRLGRRFFEELAIPRTFDLNTETPFERHRILDPASSATALANTWRQIGRSFPVFQGARIAHAWAGYIDVTPDSLPVMAPIESIPGLYLASGFSGHGFGIGPAVGECMAEMIQGNSSSIDMRPFQLSRFGKQKI